MGDADDAKPAGDDSLFTFEGAEKKLEIDFGIRGKPRVPLPSRAGLRSLDPAFWDQMCALLHGSVLMRSEEKAYDSLLITESSTFIYPDKVIMLTCGTTRLLNTLQPILEAAATLGLEVCWFQYSHKNFARPSEQSYPYRSFGDEMAFLKGIFEHGSAHVLGPVSADHFYLFMSDHIQRDMDDAVADESPDKDQMMNIYMYDIDPTVSKLFYKQGNGNDSSGVSSAEEATRLTGIRDAMSVVGGRVTHDHLFDPCGYSINGVCGGNDEAYWTIHVTPESHCSYASFETNLDCASYEPVIRGIVAVFNPTRFQTIEHVDQDSTIGSVGRVAAVRTPTVMGRLEYALHNRSMNEFEPGYIVQMCNYKVRDGSSLPATVEWSINKCDMPA